MMACQGLCAVSRKVSPLNGIHVPLCAITIGLKPFSNRLPFVQELDFFFLILVGLSPESPFQT